MPKILENYATIGDLLVECFAPAYNFEGRKVVNSTAAAQNIKTIGMPVKTSGSDWVVVLATDEANTEGLLVETRSVEIDASGGKTVTKMNAIIRGPAVVDISAFPDNDPAGTAYTKSAIKTALESLSPPIIVLDDSDRETVDVVESA